jgi:hypothetical protein
VVRTIGFTLGDWISCIKAKFVVFEQTCILTLEGIPMLFVRLLASLILLVGYIATPVHAATMTFDSLLGLFDEFSTYTEDGITLFAANGAPDHFHDDFNFVNGTTGATIFSSDGGPQRIIFNTGASLFSLTSLEVWDIDASSGPITFTASSGATQLVSATGTVVFGSGFNNVSFVQIDVPDPSNDIFVAIDDIHVATTTIPEPGTLGLLSLGLGCLVLVRRRVWAGRPSQTVMN